MLKEETQAAILAGYRDYVLRLFATRVSNVNSGAMSAVKAREAFRQSLSVATAEFNLALAELNSAGASDKTGSHS
jgi:hypothetical protein